MHIVLVEPEIPYNTGNIARTCAVTGTVLHLVRPLGFSTDDRYLKRAGLDYWHLVDIRYHDSFQEIIDNNSNRQFFFATTKGGHAYTSFDFDADSFLVFGKETKGLPKEILEAHPEHCLRIPMRPGQDVRSLNLANAVAVILYEALRQQEFNGLV